MAINYCPFSPQTIDSKQFTFTSLLIKLQVLVGSTVNDCLSKQSKSTHDKLSAHFKPRPSRHYLGVKLSGFLITCKPIQKNVNVQELHVNIKNLSMHDRISIHFSLSPKMST